MAVTGSDESGGQRRLPESSVLLDLLGRAIIGIFSNRYSQKFKPFTGEICDVPTRIDSRA